MADRTVSVKLQADISGYVSDMAKAAAATKALGDSATNSSRQVKSTSDEAAKSTTTLGEKAKQSNEKVKDSTEKVRLSAQEAIKQLGGVRAELTQLGRNKVGVGLDTVAARTELARLRELVAQLEKSDPDVRVDAEVAAAQAQIRAIQSQLNSIDGQSVRATVDVDDRGSTTRAASNMHTLWATAAAASPVFGAVGAAAVAGLGVIAPLAASAAAGLGVLALGFSGVGDAVKLLDQRQEAVAVNAAKGAASQVSSARQVQAAQDSLSNARANAASGAIRAAERVTDAERNMARARQDAAEDVQRAQQRASENVLSALRQQEQAERTLTDAQEDREQAQTDLTYAMADARRELEDMNAELRNSALDEEGALLNVERARQRLNEVIASGAAAESLERREADLAHRQAVTRLEDLRVRNSRLADDVRVANARGVEGSEQVVDARERVADAERTVADAARAAGEAAVAVDRARAEGAAEVARAQRDGAEKIADAQRQVASAVREQAEQQRQSAYSIEQAQRAVEAAMVSTGTAGVAALAGIDAKLAEVNPSTLKFARFWDSEVQPALERVKETAAAGLLPGVQEGIESLLASEPRIAQFVDTYARSLGNLTRDSLANLSNAQWQRFWDMLESQGVPQLEAMWRSGDNVAEAFASIAVAFAPMATDVAGGIEDLTGRFARWSADLERSEGFHAFTDYVRENWPRIREIIANVAETVGNLIEAGAPIGSAYLQGFVLLTEVLSALPVGVVQALLIAFLGFKAAQSVVGIITGVANSILALQTNIAGLPAKVSAATGSVGRLGGALSGVTGVLGGPFGVALAAGGVMIGTFAADMQQASTQTDAWAQALLRGGAAAAQARREYAEDDYFLRSLDEWTGLAPSMEDAERAARGLWQQMTPLQQAQAKAAEWSSILNQRLNDENATTAEVEAAKRRYAYWTGEESRMQGELAAVTEDTSGTLATQGTVYADLSAAASTQLGVYRDVLRRRSEAEVAAAGNTQSTTAASSVSWASHVKDVSVSLDEYARQLEEQVVGQQNWRRNIVTVTQRGGDEVGQILLEMGEEGVGLAAQMATATDAEFKRMRDAMIAHARSGGQGAKDALKREMDVMTEVGRAGAGATAYAIAEKLGLGTFEVQRIARQYGIDLASGINPLLDSLGKQRVVLHQATGRGYQANADGNLYERHDAQIAPGGAMRLWAEPETGGEAYIPLAPAKRGRSLDIWRETGRRLGVGFQEFARGGFYTPESVPKPRSTDPFRMPISTGADAAMGRSYDEVSAFVRANTEPKQSASGGSANGLLPHMAAARQYVMDTYGVRNIGGFARRNIAGTNVVSDHALGKAIDIMTSAKALGWAIANDFAFGEARRRFNIENVIWQQSISSRGGPFRRMADRGSVTQNHYDHIHADTYDRGGILPHGGIGVNLSGQPERILDPQQTKAFDAIVSREFSGTSSASSPTVNVAAPSLDGLAITGRLSLDADGFVRIVDGRLEDMYREKVYG